MSTFKSKNITKPLANTIRLEMSVDMKFLLFLQFTPDHKKNFYENYNYYSTVTNLVLNWACVHYLRGN